MLAIVMVMPVIIVELVTEATIVIGEFRLVFLLPVAFWGFGAWAAWKEHGEDPPAG